MICDIVICAHNEESTIASVIDVCNAAGVGKTIVVADNCQDQTLALTANASTVIESRAGDKGTAMWLGLQQVEAPQVLFCDADLIGLRPSHIQMLAYAKPEYGQVVGLTESMINKWSGAGLPPITGERRLPTNFARKIPMQGQGYKVELVIDAAVGAANLPHKAYVMRGVSNPTRMYTDPVGWSAMWADLGITSLRYLPDLARYTVNS